ncbi:OB-fold-containig protein [Microvirga terricola]|uniref:YqiJ family protein n=1 Tax=Microvirga terricola TaxID=2719797 RepID=A0ABX0VEN4_9HYPH|nr:OB-fold-containig protein [Microvirga terricola]NIX76347.1 YqiJ family protein [Microvirga terricola]
MDTLLSASYQPFTIAGLIMVGLVLIETASLIVGFSLSLFIEQGLDPDVYGGHPGDVGSAGSLGGLMGWLNAGRVPVLILIITWLAAFAAVGFVIQTLAISFLAPLPVLVASLIAFCVATPTTRTTTRLVSAIVPRDETYAVSNEDLVGRIAEVTLGPLDQGPAGRVKVQDPHGNWHFLMAKAAAGETPIPTGASVLLVDRNGPTFLAIPAPKDLTPTS